MPRSGNHLKTLLFMTGESSAVLPDRLSPPSSYEHPGRTKGCNAAFNRYLYRERGERGEHYGKHNAVPHLAAFPRTNNL